MVTEQAILKMSEYFPQSVVRSCLSAWESGYLKLSKKPGEKLSIQEAGKLLFTLIVCKPNTVLECISTLNVDVDDAYKHGNESKMRMFQLQAILTSHLIGVIVPLSELKELRFGYKSEVKSTVFPEEGVVFVGNPHDPTQIILPGDFLRWFVKNFVA